MTTPANRLAVAVRPPAARTRLVADIDPATGVPWSTLVARLAMPCPRKSPEGSLAEPSGLVIVPPMAAPWTRPTKTSERAGTTIAATRPSEGSVRGPGRLRGTVTMSESTGTASTVVPRASSTTGSADPRAIATTIPSAPSGVRSSSTMSPIVTAATTTLAHWIWPGWTTVSRALSTRLLASLW